MIKKRATVFRIDSTEKLPSGALRVEGNLTKTGIFDYSFNGETIREARQDSEVFKPESLDTLRGAPVTVEHPSRFVGTDNWSLLSVGHVLDAKAEPPYVRGQLLIFDQKAIQQIEDGKLVELSMGYTMEAQDAPEGSNFDFIQANITYNHAALGPSGWGRLGSDVSLRLDHKHDLIFEDFNMQRTDKNGAEIVEQAEGVEPQAELEVADGEPAVATEPAELAPEIPPEEAEDEAPALSLDTIKQILDQHGEALARLEGSIKPAEEKTDSVDLDVDKLVEARVNRVLKVRDAHAKVCPGSAQAGRGTRELCLEILARVDSDTDEAASDEILEAKAEAAAAATPDKGPNLSARLLGHPVGVPGDRSFSARLLERSEEN